MDDMEEELLSTEIFGMAVPTGKTVTVGTALPKEDAEHVVHHLTQFALGDAPSQGRHVVWLQPKNGPKIAIGTLELGRVEHFQVDFMAQAPLQISHSGGSDVYLSGYKTVYPMDMGEDDRDDDDYVGTDEDEDSDEDDEESGDEEEEGVGAQRRQITESSDDDDEEADPAELELMKKQFQQEALDKQLPPRLTGKKAKAAAAALVDDEAEDEDDDGEDDSEDESEEDSEEEGGAAADESEEEGAADGLNGRERTPHGPTPIMQMQEFSSMDDDDDDDNGDEESSDEEEEAPALVPAPAVKTPKKRPAEEAVQTPKAAKQPKGAAQTPAAVAATPKAAKTPKQEPKQEPKTPATGGGTPADHSAAEAAYEQQLKQYLTEHGPQKLSTLGVSVPKPAAMPKSAKMKKFLETRPIFTVDSLAGLVTLK